MRIGGDERQTDWQLPRGVDRALWEYMSAAWIAEEYDRFFAQTNLVTIDRAFLSRFFLPPGRLIDLGCGSGRLLAHFASRGLEVVGVDLSVPMLKVAMKKLETSEKPASLVRANLCDLSMLRDASFDYAACMFSTLGMVIGADQRRLALAEVHRLLRPGGLFGFHLHNLWNNLYDPQGRRWLISHLVRSLVGKVARGDKTMEYYRGIPNLRLHLFTRREIRRELRHAGFDRVCDMPLSPDRSEILRQPWLASGLRANGWLLMFRRR